MMQGKSAKAKQASLGWGTKHTPFSTPTLWFTENKILKTLKEGQVIFVTCTIIAFIHFLLSYVAFRRSLNLKKKSFAWADVIKEQLMSCNK